jgi:hypothetical protein
MVKIPELVIGDINIFTPLSTYSIETNKQPFFQHSPVTVDIGVPLINIPGCVQSHKNLSSSKNILEDDARGNQVFCDGNLPSFTPLNFTPGKFIYTPPASVPNTDAGSKNVPNTTSIPDSLPVPAVKTVKKKESVSFDATPINCPSKEALAVGQRTADQTAIIIGYEWTGEKCITVIEPVPLHVAITEEYLPPPQAISTTAAIALVATTSALLAKPLSELLLKLIKPLIKKITKKVAALSNKPIKIESVSQRRLQQRDRNRTILALRRVLNK